MLLSRRQAVWRLASAAVMGTSLAIVAGESGSADAAERATVRSTDGWDSVRNGAIVLLRHAQAPGIGDPPGIRVGNCSTQRNLSEAGRAQSCLIGEAFRTRGVTVGRVLTSQWCRCRETAELAFPGQVNDEPAFNSFFETRNNEPAQTDAARAILKAWSGPGVLVVVTHQVNITALTGATSGSGEGTVVQLSDGKLTVVGSILR